MQEAEVGRADDAAAVRFVRPGEQPEQGRLAGPFSPINPIRCPGAAVGDPVEHPSATEGTDEVMREQS
ncbi:hypothetical protein V1634_22435 [Plantactinospora veratri]|uniref:Uncharacterized protein n=1 Tax=Plantactinospora veratri TaxID=1436122 RepID=A0ABU7SI02_9ACTN